MAREQIDETGNENISSTWNKINRMFAELFAGAQEGGEALEPITEALTTHAPVITAAETPAAYSIDPADLAAALVAAGLMAPDA